MKLCAILLLVAATLVAADEMRQALDVKAQADFDRVDLSGVARLDEAGQCVQSQAAALAVPLPADAPLLHYRKGFCLMAAAAVTRRPGDYAAAADELEKAIETWPARTSPAQAKKGISEPVSPGLRALAVIARLEAGPDAASLQHARQELTAIVSEKVCSADVMPPAFCQQLVEKGREWLGWMAWKNGDLPEAARDFAGSTGGWVDWIAGTQAFAAAGYRAAAQRYDAALRQWEIERHASPANLLQSFAPQPDWSESLTDLGGAQLLAGDPTAALATLNRADPKLARTFYLRARAKEAAGDSAGALTDYNLASRTAFAGAQDMASGEAHLYRGILLYRRKDWVRAEDEFASALNFAIPAPLRADAEAWRHLAAVAGGSCEASRAYLERSLETVSPYFPKAEARAVAASCSTRETAGIHGARIN